MSSTPPSSQSSDISSVSCLYLVVSPLYLVYISSYLLCILSISRRISSASCLYLVVPSLYLIYIWSLSHRSYLVIILACTGAAPPKSSLQKMYVVCLVFVSSHSTHARHKHAHAHMRTSTTTHTHTHARAHTHTTQEKSLPSSRYPSDHMSIMAVLRLDC